MHIWHGNFLSFEFEFGSRISKILARDPSKSDIFSRVKLDTPFWDKKELVVVSHRSIEPLEDGDDGEFIHNDQTTSSSGSSSSSSSSSSSARPSLGRRRRQDEHAPMLFVPYASVGDIVFDNAPFQTETFKSRLQVSRRPGLRLTHTAIPFINAMASSHARSNSPFWRVLSPLSARGAELQRLPMTITRCDVDFPR